MTTHKRARVNLLFVLLTLAVILGLLATSPVKAKAPAPRNVIVMISDGMSFNQNLVASYYREGKADTQVYTNFPIKYAMSTYAGAEYMGAPPGDPCFGWGYDPARAWNEFDYVTRCYTDSASAATAMATGVKTYNAAIGVDLYGNPVKNVLEAAEEKGKSTGVITSVPISHATPASFVAHNISRNDYGGIAREMINLSAADVIMGAGHPWYDDSSILRAAPNYRYVSDATTWDALVAGTAGNDADGDGDFDPWTLLQSRSEFQALMQGPTPGRVFGLAQVYSTLQQSRSGDVYVDPYVVPFTQSVPTLVEMTKAALNILDDDPDGLFLMIEGGAVDWAAHSNQSGRTIEEQIDFDQAVEAVMEWVHTNSNWGETLLIVTGDHETGYLLGPGSNPTWEPIVNNGQGVLPGMQWNSPNHTNSLLPFFAKSDDARWFRGYATLTDPVRGKYLDNTSIAQVIFNVLEGK
ncbi:MAG TPA: alkaline phosphatase [Anaerolineales bacterium]|nr:alkaline phosphatase [Anaerolineales bacterium]